MQIKNTDNEKQLPYIQELDLQIEALEKEGYDHFMLKEIYEQPKTIRDAMRGRISSKDWLRCGCVAWMSTLTVSCGPTASSSLPVERATTPA